jgi:hypothetical protein
MKFSFVLAGLVGGVTVLALPSATNPASFKHDVAARRGIDDMAKRDAPTQIPDDVLRTLAEMAEKKYGKRDAKPSDLTPNDLAVLKLLHDLSTGGGNSKRDLDYWENFKIGMGTLFNRETEETPKRDLDYWENFKIGMGTLFNRDVNEVTQRDLDYWENFKTGMGTLFSRGPREITQRDIDYWENFKVGMGTLFDRDASTLSQRDLDYWENFKIGMGTLFDRNAKEITQRDIDYWENFKIGMGTLFDRRAEGAPVESKA